MELGVSLKKKSEELKTGVAKHCPGPVVLSNQWEQLHKSTSHLQIYDSLEVEESLHGCKTPPLLLAHLNKLDARGATW